MEVILKNVSKNQPYYKKIKRLYKNAFPISERAPFWFLISKSRKENVDFWALFDKQKFIGLIYVVNFSDLSYIFYFAILDSERGKGYGSKVLEVIKDKYLNRRIFLAIEQLDKNSENYEERVKRKQFYMKNGFMELKLKLKEAAIVYELLGIGGTISPKEYDLLIEAYAGKLLKKFITMNIIN